jgi:hypothetical protein
MNPKFLEIQPESTEPLIRFMFDFHCGWEYDNLPANAEILQQLEAEFTHVDTIPPLIKQALAGELKESEMFHRIGVELINAGYYVYDSDTLFEVYDTLDAEEIELELSCSEEEAK